MKQVAHDSNSNITSEHAPQVGSLILFNERNFIRDQLSMKSSIELTVILMPFSSFSGLGSGFYTW